MLTIPDYAAFTYYTLDGTSPDNTKNQYTGGVISISGESGTSKTLKVVSYDAAGNPGNVFSAVYNFGEEAPVVIDPVVDPTPSQNITSSVKIKAGKIVEKFKGTIHIATNKFKLKQEDSDLSNGTVKIYKGDSLWKTVSIDVAGAWSKTLKLGNNVTKTIKLYFYDAFGNLLGTQKAKIKVDKDKPEFKEFITPFYIVSAGDYVRWKATDNKEITRYSVYFNGRKFNIKKPSYKIPLKTHPGTYVITVKAYDAAGNSTTKKTWIKVR
jgi:hypothetical protein